LGRPFPFYYSAKRLISEVLLKRATPRNCMEFRDVSLNLNLTGTYLSVDWSQI